MGKGRNEQARKVLVQKYQNVPGYDIDHELSIIEATIERQRAWSLEAKAHGPLAIFKGLNGKRFLIGSWPKVLQQFVGLSIFSSYSAHVPPQHQKPAADRLGTFFNWQATRIHSWSQ